MSRESIVIVVGILIVIVPHLGVPEVWKLYFLTAVGVVLVVVGYLLRYAAYMRSLEHKEGERRADSFVEHIHHT